MFKPFEIESTGVNINLAHEIMQISVSMTRSGSLKHGVTLGHVQTNARIHSTTRLLGCQDGIYIYIYIYMCIHTRMM